MNCSKCGKPIVTADRGNITLGIPDGFDHIDCGKAAYIDPGDCKKKPSVEKVIEETTPLPTKEEKDEDIREYFYSGDEPVCLMEEKDEADSEEDSEGTQDKI